jgi:hypothetical protein
MIEAKVLMSSSDFLRIIMTLVTHYDLELHQMDVKTAFLNVDLLDNVYMAQPKGFAVKWKEHMRCYLRKSIYGLKHVSRQWYLKFDENIRSFGFKKWGGQLHLCKVQEQEIHFPNPVCGWYSTP